VSSILDVTENQIFHTLGRGKLPQKPMEKLKPIEKQAPVIEKQAPVIFAPSPEIDEFMKKLIEELNELNASVNNIQKMIKWFVIPLFIVVLALLLVLTVRFLSLIPHV
jgi:hypothetical protein